MEQAKRLVASLYEPEDVVIMDCIIKYGELTEDEISKHTLLSLQVVRAVCTKFAQHSICVNQELNFHPCKWNIHPSIDSAIKAKFMIIKNYIDRQEHMVLCTRCNSTFEYHGFEHCSCNE